MLDGVDFLLNLVDCITDYGDVVAAVVLSGLSSSG